eukprot:scaffold56669_cov57-Attheya_sp.AAC.1
MFQAISACVPDVALDLVTLLDKTCPIQGCKNFLGIHGNGGGSSRVIKRGGCGVCRKGRNGVGSGTSLSFGAIVYEASGGVWRSSRLAKEGGVRQL